MNSGLIGLGRDILASIPAILSRSSLSSLFKLKSLPSARSRCVDAKPNRFPLRKLAAECTEGVISCRESPIRNWWSSVWAKSVTEILPSRDVAPKLCSQGFSLSYPVVQEVEANGSRHSEGIASTKLLACASDVYARQWKPVPHSAGDKDSGRGDVVVLVIREFGVCRSLAEAPLSFLADTDSLFLLFFELVRLLGTLRQTEEVCFVLRASPAVPGN